MKTLTIIPIIKWEYSGLEHTAKVIYAINPNSHRNVESVENYIISLATKYAIESVDNGEVPTMTGTGGWYVTFIPSDGDSYDYNVEVSVMSYVIARYLKLI